MVNYSYAIPTRVAALTKNLVGIEQIPVRFLHVK